MSMTKTNTTRWSNNAVCEQSVCVSVILFELKICVCVPLVLVSFVVKHTFALLTTLDVYGNYEPRTKVGSG